MKDKNKSPQKSDKLKKEENYQAPDDSLKPVEEKPDEQPEIFKISKRGKSIDRKEFLKSAAAIGGLAALGSLIQGCEESQLDIETNAMTCTCHAHCTCDSVSADEEAEYDSTQESQYNYDYTVCTCNMVCTCDQVCTCNTVCTCDSEGGGGGGTYYYTYWYPN